MFVKPPESDYGEGISRTSDGRVPRARRAPALTRRSHYDMHGVCLGGRSVRGVDRIDRRQDRPHPRQLPVPRLHHPVGAAGAAEARAADAEIVVATCAGRRRSKKIRAGRPCSGSTARCRVPVSRRLRIPETRSHSRATRSGPNSALDPYIYMQAMDGIAPPPDGKSGGAKGVVASNGQRFSYNYAIPGLPVRQAGDVRVRQRNDRRHVPDGQPGVGELQQREPRRAGRANATA